jgi:flagellar basal-body rod protein FlgC
MRIDQPISALKAFGTGMQVTANNIANVNTDEFRPSSTRFEELPDRGGVRVGEIRESEQPGPLVERTVQKEQPDGHVRGVREMVEASGTQMAREMTDLVRYERSWDANVATLRTWDEMTGFLVDELV